MEKKILINNQEIILSDYQKKSDSLTFSLDGEKFEFKTLNGKLNFNDSQIDYRIADDHIVAGDLEAIVSLKANREQKNQAEGAMIAPMPCKVFKILKSEGESVQEGETILILEAMKMEHAVKADKTGVVEKIHFKIGELVPVGALLAEIDNAK